MSLLEHEDAGDDEGEEEHDYGDEEEVQNDEKNSQNSKQQNTSDDDDDSALHRHEVKERGGYPYVEGDIKWDACATVVYPVVCTVAGFFAGMFGVGGGIVKGPLMLAMGVHPKVCHHHDAFGGALWGV